jgi:hypothetical protein
MDRSSEQTSKFDEYVTETRCDPAEIYQLGFCSADPSVMRLAADELLSSANISDKSTYGLHYLLYNNGKELSSMDVEGRVTGRPAFAEILGTSLIQQLGTLDQQTISGKDLMRYTRDCLSLSRGLLVLNALEDEEASELVSLYVSKSPGREELQALVKEPWIFWERRQPALRALFDRASADSQLKQPIEGTNTVDTDGLGRFLKDLTKKGINPEYIQPVFNETVEFLETEVPEPYYYVPQDQLFDIARFVTDLELRFKFMLRHLKAPEQIGQNNQSGTLISSPQEAEMLLWMSEQIGTRPISEVDRQAVEKDLVEIFDTYEHELGRQQQRNDRLTGLMGELGCNTS